MDWFWNCLSTNVTTNWFFSACSGIQGWDTVFVLDKHFQGFVTIFQQDKAIEQCFVEVEIWGVSIFRNCVFFWVIILEQSDGLPKARQMNLCSVIGSDWPNDCDDDARSSSCVACSFLNEGSRTPIVFFLLKLAGITSPHPTEHLPV